MDPSHLNVVIAVSVAVGIGIAMMRLGRRNERLGAMIEPLLRERGPMTLPALSEALGMGSFLSRGKVVLALQEMIAQGKVEVIPAPAGTAQLDKVNHIRYGIRAAAEGAAAR